MKTLVYTGPDHAGRIVADLLGTYYNVCCVPATPEDLLPAFYQAAVFLDASMKVPLSADDIARATQLELIVTATTGANHIHAPSLEARAIPLLTLKGQTEVLRGITASAELSWALLMACARKLNGAFLHVAQGQWERVAFPGLMLRGRTLGVIGFGRNGSWMARYALAFGMNVRAYDPFCTSYPEGVTPVDLNTLLETSDCVTLHVHLSPETTGMLDAAHIARFKHGALFINTSRGELVDEHAIVAALERGQLAAVGADVLGGEPAIRDNPLWIYAQTHDSVVLTPHIGGFCADAVDHVVRFSAQRILAHAEGRS